MYGSRAKPDRVVVIGATIPVIVGIALGERPAPLELAGGLLSVVAVLTALYPASTVFLARVFLRETLSRMQWIGVGFAAAGVALIAA